MEKHQRKDTGEVARTTPHREDVVRVSRDSNRDIAQIQQRRNMEVKRPPYRAVVVGVLAQPHPLAAQLPVHAAVHDAVGARRLVRLSV